MKYIEIVATLSLIFKAFSYLRHSRLKRWTKALLRQLKPLINLEEVITRDNVVFWTFVALLLLIVSALYFEIHLLLQPGIGKALCWCMDIGGLTWASAILGRILRVTLN